jgi:hypothetical protein
MNESTTRTSATASRSRFRRRWPSALAATAVATVTMALGGFAATPAVALPAWEAYTHGPSQAAPGETFKYFVSVENVGNTPSAGPISLRITAPPGLTITGAPGGGGTFICPGPFPASVTTCTRPVAIPANAGNGSVTTSSRDFDFAVDPAAPLGDAEITVEVFGGGAPAPGTTRSERLTVGPSPGFGIYDFDALIADAGRNSETQAGAHPFEMTTIVRWNTAGTAFLGGAVPPEEVKNLKVELPAGFMGDPSATPQKCPREAFSTGANNAIEPPCPRSSQVGIVRTYGGGGQVPGRAAVGLYNMEPPPGLPAQFGFRIRGVTTFLDAGVRTGGDYGLTARIGNITEANLNKAELTLWGFPSDSRYDTKRGSCLSSPQVDSCSFDGPRKPFLTNPTDCSAGPLSMSAAAESWEDPGDFKGMSFTEDLNGNPIQFEGCEQLDFDPSISVQPVNPKPDAPSGYEVELTVPQNPDPDGLATSHLRRAVVTLPEGVSVSPSSAHGLQACSPAQIGLDNASEPTCPDASKIGTLEIDTPLLDEPMTGDVYVAKQKDNPFGTLLAIYLVGRGPGVLVKLPGRVDADPRTGQLTTTFDNTPRLPFSSFRLRFKGGPTAPLANPPTCGPKTVTSTLAPWSGNAPAHPSDTFTIDCPGIAGFAPSFTAGSTMPTGGSFSPFAVRIERPDGQQYVHGLTLEMPPGLIAKLKDVPLCPDAQAAAGSCGIESRVGTATVGAGPGSNPYFLQGSVSLTGPYKGAPYGLAVAVRAVAGPYDLGMVVVRQAVFIDPVDAHITVVSDPFPTILEGIPLRLRSVNVDIDRPGFMMTPTSCAEKTIRATMSSTAGAVHQVSQRFQVAGCQALPLRPRLGLRLTGRRQTNDGRHPGLRAVLTQGSGQANLEKVAVKLPLALALDPDNAQSLCEYEDGLRVNCPASSIIGRARAVTPVLNRPLEGPVYFVKGVRFHPRTGRRIRTLPTLLVPLRGEVALDLRATSSVRRGKLITTFATVPDAPVSRFELNLEGGRNGILVVTNGRNLCRGPQVAGVEMDGQNGKRKSAKARMRTPCGQSRVKRR